MNCVELAFFFQGNSMYSKKMVKFHEKLENEEYWKFGLKFLCYSKSSDVFFNIISCIKIWEVWNQYNLTS